MKRRTTVSHTTEESRVDEALKQKQKQQPTIISSKQQACLERLQRAGKGVATLMEATNSYEKLNTTLDLKKKQTTAYGFEPNPFLPMLIEMTVSEIIESENKKENLEWPRESKIKLLRDAKMVVKANPKLDQLITTLEELPTTQFNQTITKIQQQRKNSIKVVEGKKERDTRQKSTVVFFGRKVTSTNQPKPEH
ncbi:hypothetical protein L3V79_04535 [Thiotrichales bacterium 19S9-12]|nr:hypothetical protein [Thiotrichales bacterium 19S9-11]MCF6811626.1 hypothetical protein [Thiotrichales bacterium 19S9-12]